jgi:Mrp family chromosome partitioning ATPase
MQTLQPIHTMVVTSPSPAEGKSFSAVNLAMAESNIAGNMTLLADFDFRRPIVHNIFQVDRSPGITDYLLGKVALHEAIRKIAGTNLCIMPAGEAVLNPLELLNLREVKILLNQLPTVFNWIILDSPPLLFAADANLVSGNPAGGPDRRDHHRLGDPGDAVPVPEQRAGHHRQRRAPGRTLQ